LHLIDVTISKKWWRGIFAFIKSPACDNDAANPGSQRFMAFHMLSISCFEKTRSDQHSYGAFFASSLMDQPQEIRIDTSSTDKYYRIHFNEIIYCGSQQ
jgi:hypothetical protein